MQVSVINSREQKNISIPLAATAGGAAGFALRQFFPVYKDEIANARFRYPNEIQEANLITMKNSFIELMKKKFSNNVQNREAVDLFIERVNAMESAAKAKPVKEKIKSMPAAVKEEIKKLNTEFLKVMKASKQISQTNIKNCVRQLRPFAPFVLPGAVIGVAAAFAYNVIGKINEN